MDDVRFYKEELKKKREERNKDDLEVKNLEKQLEEKMKKVKLLEDEVNQLEVKAAKAPASVKSDGGARKKERKSHPKPLTGEGSPPSLPFLSF